MTEYAVQEGGPEPCERILSLEEFERQHSVTMRARLGANETLFDWPQEMRERLAFELMKGLGRYCDPESYGLKCALAAKLSIDSSRILVDAGIDAIVNLACRALLFVGAGTLHVRGTYPTFGTVSRQLGARTNTVEYTTLATPFSELVHAARVHQPTLVYVANPDNPTGYYLKGDDLVEFIDSVPRESILLLDEAYTDFVSAEHILPAEYHRPNMLRLRTFSKLYGLAGLKIGYAIGDPQMIAFLDSRRSRYGVGCVAQGAALTCLDHPSYLEGFLRQYEECRELFVQKLDAAGIRTLEVPTNFVLVDLASAATRDVVFEGLNQRGIFVRQLMHPFGTYLRVSIGPEPLMVTCAREIAMLASGRGLAGP